MKILNLIHNYKITGVIAVLILAVAVTLIYFQGLKFGTDFSKGTEATFYSETKINTQDLEKKVKKDIPVLEKVNVAGNTYSVIFSGTVKAEDITSALQKADQKLGEITVFNYQASQIAYVKVRMMYSAELIALAFVIFVIFSLRGKGLTYSDIIALALSDLLLLCFELLIVFAGFALLGVFHIFINEMLIILAVLLAFILLIIKIFATLRFQDFLSSHEVDQIAPVWKRFTVADWPTTTFIVAFVFILLIVPITVLGAPIIYFIPVMLFTILVAYISELSFKILLTKGIDFLVEKIPLISTLKNRKW
ncbi:MAG: hypothetical protein WCJ58_04790 [bacterium]